MTRSIRLAVIPGDGIGPEVIEQANRVLDAAVVVHGPDGATDEIASYLGMRDVTITGDALSLTGRPFYLRSVLEQGYWEESHLTPPSGRQARPDAVG